jgi:hypothetical protein
MPGPGTGGWCYRAESADEMVAIHSVSDLDSVELRFLEERELDDAEADDRR